MGVKNQVLGIFGWNIFAQKLVNICSSLGMKSMIYHSETQMQTRIKEEMSCNQGVTIVDNLDDLLKNADIVSLHVELNDENEEIVDEYFLE